MASEWQPEMKATLMNINAWARTAACLSLVVSLSIGPAQGAASDEQKPANSAGVPPRPSGHRPMPERPFTLPADHTLRLVSIGVDPVYKDISFLRPEQTDHQIQNGGLPGP